MNDCRTCIHRPIPIEFTKSHPCVDCDGERVVINGSNYERAKEHKPMNESDKCKLCGREESAWCRLELCDGRKFDAKDILESVLYIAREVEYDSNREWADAVEQALEDAAEVLDNTELA